MLRMINFVFMTTVLAVTKRVGNDNQILAIPVRKARRKAWMHYGSWKDAIVRVKRCLVLKWLFFRYSMVQA